MNYKHLVEYDPASNKIIIYRLLDSDVKHLYTEIMISEVDKKQRNFAGLGRLLGEALIVDMTHLRDIIT